MDKIEKMNSGVKKEMNKESFNVRKYAVIGMRMVFWLAAISVLAGYKSMSDGIDVPDNMDPMLSIFILFGSVFCLISVVVVCSDIFMMLSSKSKFYKTISQLCIVSLLLWFLYVDKAMGIVALITTLAFAILFYADKKYNLLDFLRR